jgi:hypothetical protein
MEHALNNNPMMEHVKTLTPPSGGQINSGLPKEVGVYGNDLYSPLLTTIAICYNLLETGSTYPNGITKVNGLLMPTIKLYYTNQESNVLPINARAAVPRITPSTRHSSVILPIHTSKHKLHLTDPISNALT